MRVLHIDAGRELRGGQWQALYLMEGLAAGGHTVTLLSPPGAPLSELARGRGLDVHALGLAAVARLSREAEITHAHDARAHTLAALAARSPLGVARRVAVPLQRNQLSRRKYARARQYIAVSEHVKRVLVAGGVPAEKISVVYDGVPLPAQPAQGEWLLAPATDDPRKGRALLERAAALAGIEVRFSSNLAEELSRAAVFVYISQSEGLGSAVLLAMAQGVPVVASRVGGLEEIIEDGRSGLLVENTPEAIAAALRRLLEDRAWARDLAACGRRRVQERFSAETMTRNTLEVYKRVLTCS
jgi:hypothetical protein